MPRPRKQIPEMRYHLSGQARVYLDGKYYYLGEHGSAAAQARYDTLVAKYLANNRRMPADEAMHQAEAVITVQNITAEYRRLIAQRPKQLSRIEHLCTLLEDEYGDLPASEFGPLKLTAIRELLVATKIGRKTINEQVRQIVRIFRHAVSRELIKMELVLALETLEPLKRGQTAAPEYKERQPVDIDVVKATAKHLSPHARAIITLQAATGMRPSEIFNMRPCDIDRSSADWFYRPEHHKTESHGVVKAVPIIGPAREALTPFLLRAADAFCFSPAESAQWHRAQRTAKRKTPLKFGGRVGQNRKANPKRKPGLKFNKDSLNQGVERACKKAGVPKWTPYQLRHTAATTVADALGMDGARALLGHTCEAMTRNYVKQKQDEAKALEAAKVAPSVG